MACRGVPACAVFCESRTAIASAKLFLSTAEVKSSFQEFLFLCSQDRPLLVLVAPFAVVWHADFAQNMVQSEWNNDSVIAQAAQWSKSVWLPRWA